MNVLSQPIILRIYEKEINKCFVSANHIKDLWDRFLVHYFIIKYWAFC